MARILFVEDEPRGVSAYFRNLERNGFQCVLAQDFDEATARLQAENYDILSLDIMFSLGEKSIGKVEPRSAGLRLLEMIRQGYFPKCDPAVKIVVLTAVLNKQIEEKIKRLGVSAYVKKPAAYNSVVETFKKLIAEASQDPEPRR